MLESFRCIACIPHRRNAHSDEQPSQRKGRAAVTILLPANATNPARSDRSAARVGSVKTVVEAYTVVVAQYASKARVSSCAIAGAVDVSIADRCIRYTNCPSRRIAIAGDVGGCPPK